jgi:hypothetical protein
LDIDAEHHAEILPEQIPSAWRGTQLGVEIPSKYIIQEFYQSTSPVDLWKALRGEASLSSHYESGSMGSGSPDLAVQYNA